MAKKKKGGKKGKKKRKGGNNGKKVCTKGGKGMGKHAAAFGMNPRLLKQAEDSMQQQRDFLKSLE